MMLSRSMRGSPAASRRRSITRRSEWVVISGCPAAVSAYLMPLPERGLVGDRMRAHRREEIPAIRLGRLAADLALHAHRLATTHDSDRGVGQRDRAARQRRFRHRHPGRRMSSPALDLPLDAEVWRCGGEVDVGPAEAGQLADAEPRLQGERDCVARAGADGLRRGVEATEQGGELVVAVDPVAVVRRARTRSGWL